MTISSQQFTCLHSFSGPGLVNAALQMVILAGATVRGLTLCKLQVCVCWRHGAAGSGQAMLGGLGGIHTLSGAVISPLREQPLPLPGWSK